MANLTLGKEAKILRMENGGASDDGLQVMFNIVTGDDTSHPFWMADSDLEKFVSYVIGLSQHAAAQSGKMKAPPSTEQAQVNPIEAVAVSVSPGRSEMEAILSIHLGTFALAFAVSPNHLKQLHDRLGQILVPTAPSKPN